MTFINPDDFYYTIGPTFGLYLFPVIQIFITIFYLILEVDYYSIGITKYIIHMVWLQCTIILLYTMYVFFLEVSKRYLDCEKILFCEKKKIFFFSVLPIKLFITTVLIYRCMSSYLDLGLESGIYC